VSKNSKRKTKAPQIFTTVLLVACPIAMAQQAQAQQISTSYAGGLLAEQRLLGLHQTGIANQRPLLLGMNPSQSLERFPYLSPSAFFKALTPEEYQKQVADATVALNRAKTALQTAISNQSSAQKALETAQTALDSAKTALEQANSALSEQDSKVQQAETAKNLAQTAYDQALQAFVTADDNLTTKTSATATALANLTSAQNVVTNDASSLTTSNTSLASAQSSLSTAQSTQQQAQQTYNQAVIAYDQAKALANQPTYYIQPTSYQIPDANFQTGEPWVGDGSGQSGQPEIHPGHLHFSYIGTEVYQDILISPRIIADYTFTVGVWNQDQNSVGQGAVADTYGLRIYFYDANNNLLHQDSVTSSQIHSWQDVVLQGSTNTTTEVAKVRIGIYGIDNGFWAGTYGPAMNNVRLLLGWAFPNQVQTGTATMAVDIGEGGESTFTAPAGSIFTGSNLRYESYSNPSCGADVTPTNLGGNTIQLVADNSVWGDPCGGESKHLVGTLTYTTQAEPDASYALAISQAQTALNIANTEVVTAQQNVSTAESQVTSAQSALSSSQQVVVSAQSAYEIAQQEESSASASKNTASATKDSAQASLTTATATYNSEVSAQSTLASKQSEAESAKDISEGAYETAQSSLDDLNEAVTEAEQEVESTQDALDNIPLPEEPEPEPKPEPTPTESPEPKPEEPEEEEKETVVLPPLDDLTKVNFAEITPTDLTAAQAEQIKEAALETFLTAEQGSPEYNAALTALMVAAQQDDIVIDEELASIPGIGQAAVAIAQVLNLLSNVGADISPQVRETAQETTVAAVIVGQIAQAAMATASASAAPSSAGRRIK
jgi:hypothetical protein